MTEKSKKTVFDRIWDVFASVKLAVVIFALISATSIVGTIIEQQAEPERNVKVLVKMFGIGHEAAHSVLRVLDSLGFTNMYHSWWFLMFLLIFAANLIICSLDRLPRIWKLVQEKIRPVPADYLEKMSIKHTLSLKDKAAGVKESVAAAFASAGFKPSEASEGQSLQLYAEKGNFTRLGVYITHLSILIILAGAIIGIFFGFNAYLPLGEGETSSVAYKDQNIQVPLGFDIRCDNFEVDFYPNSEMPKAYKSWLTVFKNGQQVMQKVIAVNDPLTFEGITFYQSSYGPVPNSTGRGVMILRAVSNDGKAEQLNLRIGESFTIPGTNIAGRIRDFSPALAFEQSGTPYTFTDQMVNPAVSIDFTEAGAQKYAGWLLKRYPNTWNLPDGNRVEFLDYWGVQYTGMQVRKDPGVFIVYLGCIIMAIGLYMTFFMSHKRIWVTITEEKGGAKVLVGASANRNKATLQHKIEKMVSAISSGQKGGK
jgi:cytochrome c biogenesis protein